ncbi:MAG: N-acetyl-gamma-glutamyl-phosphate reductase [Planctomycetota bacterium]|nr:MAG: N-acetyl-gamma-glutamyl-phosphate reductase [Planctomycetota bacterium]
MATIRTAILGATGYAAKELIRLLLGHPHAEITVLTTRSTDVPWAGDVHPVFRGRLDLRLENLDAASIAARADCVFSCLPHAASAEAVVELLAAGLRVIDLSADYRLNDPAVYKKWYEHDHPDPTRLAETVYGLPELYRQAIPRAQLVANPGCYPTSAILPLAPLLRERAVLPAGIIIDSKSGVSGAGRTPKAHLHFPECNEAVSAYGVGSHRHTPEIDQVLSDFADVQTEVIFTPHLIPMDRGILTTAYATLSQDVDAAGLLAVLRRQYAHEPFVRVVDGLPSTKDVVGTNCCDMTVRVVRGRAVVVSAIDNLVKGAAGAAVQNFNLMYDLDETTALR